jgi:hypothetical protein
LARRHRAKASGRFGLNLPRLKGKRQVINKYDPDRLVTYNGGSRHMTLRQAVERYRHERAELSPTDTVELHTDGHGEDSIITEKELQELIEHPDFVGGQDGGG